MPFLLGANLPWLSYGGDFGANAWRSTGGLAQRTDLDPVAERLAGLAGLGVRHVRWFLFCDGRAGLRFEEDGTPAGLDEAVPRDLDAALSLAERAGVRLQFTLLDFHWCRRARRVGRVQTGGRARVLATPRGRAALVERVLVPVFRRYTDEPTVWSWDVINEPEWVTRGIGTRHPRATDVAAMRAFLRAAVDAAHAETRQPVTVGSASLAWIDLVRGLGLDFYAPHWYDALDARAPLDRPVASAGLDRPALLGEFPTAGSARPVADVIATAERSGYHGAFAWSVFAEDAATDPRAIEPALVAWRSQRNQESGVGSQG